MPITIVLLFSAITSVIVLIVAFGTVSNYLPESHNAHGFMRCFSYRPAIDALFSAADTGTGSIRCINGIRYGNERFLLSSHNYMLRFSQTIDMPLDHSRSYGLLLDVRLRQSAGTLSSARRYGDPGVVHGFFLRGRLFCFEVKLTRF